MGRPSEGISRIVIDDNDAASDASSDLFEIESFSTATQSSFSAVPEKQQRLIWRRIGDDGDDGLLRTGLLRTEWSEWSVTTVDDETKKVFPAARATRCFGREENGVGGGYWGLFWKRWSVWSFDNFLMAAGISPVKLLPPLKWKGHGVDDVWWWWWK